LLVVGCHVIVRDRWCYIIALNVHAPSEDKSGDSKDRFCEGLEKVVINFRKYNITFCLEILMQNWGRAVFKSTPG